MPALAQNDTATVAAEVHRSGDTTHTPVTTVLSGDRVHGKATVSGNNGVPTGSVSFFLFANGDCSGGVGNATFLGDIPLDAAGVAHPSGDSNPLAAGSWSILARYGGDPTYLQTESCAPFTVLDASAPIVVTEVHDSNHNPIVAPVLEGVTVHDQATVSGTM
ncbi:MAG TPA: Ig-like domain repeat protein, partial [Candidatus Udaeobacter sp.]|nr:Ig-like domain repeat protein [Candidatus Udaeobacter sp.]